MRNGSYYGRALPPLYTLFLPNVTCDKIPNICILQPIKCWRWNSLETSLASLQVEAKLSVMLKNKDLAILVASNLLPSLTLHWKQLAEIRASTKMGRAFEYQEAKVNFLFLGQGCGMPFIFQAGLRALHQPQTHTHFS